MSKVFKQLTILCLFSRVLASEKLTEDNVSSIDENQQNNEDLERQQDLNHLNAGSNENDDNVVEQKEESKDEQIEDDENKEKNDQQETNSKNNEGNNAENKPRSSWCTII